MLTLLPRLQGEGTFTQAVDLGHAQALEGAVGELTAHSPAAVSAQLGGRKRYGSGSPRGS